MPHKRSKKSVRDEEKGSRKTDLPPSQAVTGYKNDGDFPKSAAWVLNAEATRSAYREKRKRERDGVEEDGKKKRRKARDGVEGGDERRAKANLTIKPGESLKHFNRRVEDDMRPLVRTAMSSTVSSSRQKLKAAERDSQTQDLSNDKRSKKPPLNADAGSDDKGISRASEGKDFDRIVTSAPRRLNDIAQAPPQLSVGTRLNSKSKVSTSDGIITAAQKRMMDLEREKAITRYRALKSAKQDPS